LCSLILEAVSTIRKIIDDEYKGDTNSNPEARVYNGPYHLPSGREVMGITSLGIYFPGSSTAVAAAGPEVEWRQTASARPGYAFPDDKSVRPWLFGNWWKVDDPSSPLQLIGLGVRLAATPYIEDAEGNGLERRYSDTVRLPDIHYRGSYLRIRTDDGKLEDGIS
jgi:hypothetical protein